jgi:hypothetical protein
MGPLRNRQGAATVVLAAPKKSVEPGIGRRAIVHRFPQATRVRRRGGDRHSQRAEPARQEQNQQESGGQTMHGLQILIRRPREY